MHSSDREKGFDESDALQHNLDNVEANESPSLDDSLSSKRSEATKGYISKSSFGEWTLVAIVGIAFCLIHSHQGSFWQWTGDTAADAQSLKAKVVVSLFSAVIGGCVAAILSKALVSVSYLILRYRGASFSHLATVIEGYPSSRFLTLAASRGWANCMLIIFMIAASVVTKQMAVVSMGVEFMATNNTKVSYTRNYTNCEATTTGSDAAALRTGVVAQVFNTILMPNSSYTNEYYDSYIPLGLAGYSQFERVLPYAEASCIQFNSSFTFNFLDPLVTGLGTWQFEITLPLTSRVQDGQWVNCTVKTGFGNALSTCNDTKCETIRTSEDIMPFPEIGAGPAPLFQSLLDSHTPTTSKVDNIVVAWLLGQDILKNLYVYAKDQSYIATTESIADRLAVLSTVITRVMCDANYFMYYDDENGIPDSPITSNYIEHFYYQYKLLWAWPFYILVGFIFILWMLCMIAMWIAPESRVLSPDWLLNQYISRNQNGYLSGKDLLRAHGDAQYQVFDNNANGNIGNIVISTAESHRLDKYATVIQRKQYQ